MTMYVIDSNGKYVDVDLPDEVLNAAKFISEYANTHSWGRWWQLDDICSRDFAAQVGSMKAELAKLAIQWDIDL